MARINVLIADGRKLLREGLSVLLHKHTGIRVMGEADDLRTAARLIGPLAIDVLILNVNAPSQSTMEQVRSVITNHDDVGVIALTHNPSPAIVRALLDAGARGCLTKECASAELVAGIRAVEDGRIYLSPHCNNALLNGSARLSAATAPTPRLAPREREILRHIATGRSTKEIAFNLGVGTKTIETHRRRIMHKLNRHSIAELTQYAVIEGLISLEMHA